MVVKVVVTIRRYESNEQHDATYDGKKSEREREKNNEYVFICSYEEAFCGACE